MSEESWKVGYRKALLAYVAKHGTPVGKDASLYGWIDRDWEKIVRHVRDCGLDFLHTEVKESEWEEFGGTFASSDYQGHGIDVTGRCKCGKMRDLYLRVSSSVGEILTALLTED